MELEATFVVVLCSSHVEVDIIDKCDTMGVLGTSSRVFSRVGCSFIENIILDEIRGEPRRVVVCITCQSGHPR